jgi:hypothetical protein
MPLSVGVNGTIERLRRASLPMEKIVSLRKLYFCIFFAKVGVHIESLPTQCIESSKQPRVRKDSEFFAILCGNFFHRGTTRYSSCVARCMTQMLLIQGEFLNSRLSNVLGVVSMSTNPTWHVK